jgi:hypothetical protein
MSGGGLYTLSYASLNNYDGVRLVHHNYGQ